MSNLTNLSSPSVRVERTFPRFTIARRWEHALLIVTFTVLLLTGLPQRYRAAEWSLILLATPERVALIQTIHHVAAVVLTFEAVFHLGRAILLMAWRKLPGDLLVTTQDVRDAWQMVRYLLFMKKDPPKFGKFNFEQKITYWFLFIGIAILIVTGFIIWFPITITRFLPGGLVPAAKLAHSTEAIVSAIFIIIWHFYHVHLERLNLSIFTGRLSEQEMRTYHQEEYRRITGKGDKTEPLDEVQE